MIAPARSISLITPTRNEAALLPRLLDSVDVARALHGRCRPSRSDGGRQWIGVASGIQSDRWSTGIALAYGLTAATGAVTGIDAGVTYCRRRLARLKEAPAFFSTRKFDQLGDWQWLGFGMRVLYTRGWRRDERSAAVQAYWYDKRNRHSQFTSYPRRVERGTRTHH